MSYFCDIENRETKEIAPGVHLCSFWGKEMLFSATDLEANVVVPLHSHPHEQISVVLSGELTLTIAGETRRLKPGEMCLIPGDVEHGAQTGDAPARVLDVFSPVRPEYQY